MKKILLINNIPTPYRTFLFDQMDKISKEHNFDISFFYQFKKEKERHWEVDCSKFSHNYEFSGKVLFGTSDYYNFKTINVDLIKYDFDAFDYIIFSPLMSFTNMLLSFLIPKEKQIHWIESNLESTSSISGAKHVIKKILLRKANKFLVPGAKSIEYINFFNANENKKFFNFPNLIDYDLYTSLNKRYSKDDINVFRKSLCIGQSTKLILVIGEVCFRKGSDKLVNIAREVKGDYKILVVGTGDLHKQLTDSVLPNEISSKIHFFGQLNQEKTLIFFAASDIFLHLARKDPSPLVCIEAITSGLVMAVSKQTGNSLEVVRNNGVTFDIDNNADIYRKISKLLVMNDEQINQLSLISTQVADNCFNPHRVISKLYEDIKQA